MKFHWKAIFGLALCGGVLTGLFSRHWVATTSVYVPAADRKMLIELSKSLKIHPVEQETLEDLPPAMPDTDSMDVVATILSSRQACTYALEQAGLPASQLESLHEQISIPRVTRSTLVLEVRGSSSSQALNLCNGLLKFYTAENNRFPLTTTQTARKRLQERCSKLLSEIQCMERDLRRMSNIQMRRLGDKLIQPQGRTKNLIEYQRLARSEAVRDVLTSLRKTRRGANDSELAQAGPLDPLSATLVDKPGKRVDSLEQSSATVRYQDLAERLSLERRYEDSVALYRSLQIQAELLQTLEALEGQTLEIVEPVTVARRFSWWAVALGGFLGAAIGVLLSRDNRPYPAGLPGESDRSSPQMRRNKVIRVDSAAAILSERLQKREATITVVGLGYVGLPLALGFAQKGFKVMGLDDDAPKIEKLLAGNDYINGQHAIVQATVASGNFSPTRDFQCMGNSDVIVICVPTPLTKNREPNISYVDGVARRIGGLIRNGALVVLESTTYPGTTEEIVLPRILEGGRVKTVGQDFFLAFSPERVDPGNPSYDTYNTTKIVGGSTPACTDLTAQLYQIMLERSELVKKASSSRAA